MKLVKISFIIAVVALVSFGLGTTSYAFHSGGVAECDGCHTMHNSEDGVAMSTTGGLTQYAAGPYLLQGSTQSEACLNCHSAPGDTGPSSYHISTEASVGVAPKAITPGGDFAWLKANYNFTVRGALNTNAGHGRGHNIVAPAFGYDVDPEYTVSPGGSFPAANLACSSCHDPHSEYRRTDTTGTKVKRTIGTAGLPIISSGSYGTSSNPSSWGAVGVYRFLAGTGYLPKSAEAAGAPAFVNNAPDAVAPSTYNRSEASTETRVAYGAGMSEWCQNCHASMHNDSYTSGVTGQVHPAGNGAKLTADVIANYGAYVKSGDLSGTAASSYSSLIPYEEGTSDYAVLKSHAVNNGSQTGGPTASANVMCLSCHRAHASGFQFMTRFAHENEFMTIADASGNSIYDDAATNTDGKIHRGMTAVEQTAAYNGRPATKFAPYQRLLCNKCHAKD